MAIAQGNTCHKRADMLIKVADFIEEYKQLFRDVLIIEGGKPINEAEGEVESTITRLRMIHQDLGRLLNVGIPGEYGGVGTENKYAIVVREPIGVVAAIAPFNYPLFTSMVKVATALLAGNPVIFKPSSYTPITGVLIAKQLSTPDSVITSPWSQDLAQLWVMPWLLTHWLGQSR